MMNSEMDNAAMNAVHSAISARLCPTRLGPGTSSPVPAESGRQQAQIGMRELSAALNNS